MKQNQEQAEIIQLYQDTSDELRRLLVHKLGNQQEAEEIAHDAYLKLCRIEHRSDIRDLRKYLFTMSVRLALNVLRKRKTEKKQLQHELITAEQQDLTDDKTSVYHLLLIEQKLELVKEALTELPEKTRHIFLLHRFEGLTYSEISKKLGLSEKTIEYHMKRALEKIIMATEDFVPLDD